MTVAVRETDEAVFPTVGRPAAGFGYESHLTGSTLSPRIDPVKFFANNSSVLPRAARDEQGRALDAEENLLVINPLAG